MERAKAAWFQWRKGCQEEALKKQVERKRRKRRRLKKEESDSKSPKKWLVAPRRRHCCKVNCAEKSLAKCQVLLGLHANRERRRG